MASRPSSDSDNSPDDEATLLGEVTPEEVHDLLPTAEEFGRGLLDDEDK